MELSEKITTAALSGQLDSTEAELLLSLHMLVMRNMYCPLSGKILDSRNSHLITVTVVGESPREVVVHQDHSSEALSNLDASALNATAVVFDPVKSWAKIN